MTDNTEPNLDEILRRIAYWNGYDSADEWDRTGHEAKAQIEHYIANQVREARIDELKQIEPPEQYIDYAMISGHDACAMCGFNAIKFGEHITNRIATLKGDDK